MKLKCKFCGDKFRPRTIDCFTGKWVTNGLCSDACENAFYCRATITTDNESMIMVGKDLSIEGEVVTVCSKEGNKLTIRKRPTA